MRAVDNVVQAGRQVDAGRTWEEKITNNTGSIEVAKRGTFRVRATGATTVTIDGVLAMTMSTDEIAVFNAGDGDPDSGKPTVTVVIGGVAAFVQVAREVERQSLKVNPLDQLG